MEIDHGAEMDSTGQNDDFECKKLHNASQYRGLCPME